MRTLVTGGAGFIGSHVLEHLLTLGHTLCVVDDLSSGKREHVPKTVPLHMADITGEGTSRIIADFKPDTIVHLAAQMDVRASTRDPVHDAQVNVLGTVRLLQAAVAHKVSCFVLASSGGAAYGDADTVPTHESAQAAPKSPYGASKVCDEVYLDMFCRSYALRGVALRFSNVYGPRQNGAGEAGVIAMFAQAMLDGRTPVIYGDGLQTRDYVYAGDVARAVGLACSRADASGVFNIGTGVATPLRDIAKQLAQLTAAHGHLLHAAARAQEVRHSALDVRRAEARLGWAPQVPLALGLERTVAAMGQAPLPIGAQGTALQGQLPTSSSPEH